MASLKDCIKRAQQQGEISAEDAQRLYRRYDQLAREILSPAAIRETMARELEAEALQKKRASLLAETIRQERQTDMLAYRDRKGNADPATGLYYMLENFGQARVDDLEHKRQAILGKAHTDLEEVLHEFRKGAVKGDLRRRGGEVKVRLENVVREAFGENTGDSKAKELAGAWAKVSEDLRQRFNAAGGAIGKLEKWGLPQVHDVEALLRAGKDTWMGYIAPLLDRDRMRNPLTGKAPSPTELTESLSYIYDNVIAEGWKGKANIGSGGSGALYTQHADHRFLIFKDADGWMKYQAEFGEGDPFAAMMGHLSSMSRDIAAMEIFGPNPQHMLFGHPVHGGGLLQYALENAADKEAAVKTIQQIQRLWEHVSGSVNRPVGTKLANGVAAARNLISASSLGSAAISALSDPAFGTVTRMFNGIPVLKTFTSYLRQFGTNSQREAVRAGLILDSAVHAMHQQARYIGSISSRTVSGYINDRVLTYSGLQAMTQAGKHAFGMDFQGLAADLSRFAWDDLPNQGTSGAAFQRSLYRHGFDADSWERIRKAPLHEPSAGATFLRPKEIAEAVDQRLADRYIAMIMRETRHAVPESTAASRAALIGTQQPGTFAGEMARSAAQFKSFGVSVIMLHGGRIFAELTRGSKARGAAYAGALLIVTTALGAVSMQLKEIANGRDPRRIDLTKEGRKFWGAALLQGGGLGIYGDFLFADVNRFGGSLAGTVGGPMIDRLDNIRRLTIGNLVEFGQGKEKTNLGRELVNFIKQNTPGSSLWFARLAWERILMDQMQYLLDSDAHTAFHKRMRQRKKDFGNEFYWRPGETSPARGPDLSRMLPPQ